MTSTDRRVIAVLTTDEYHALATVRDFQSNRRRPYGSTYVAVTRCGIETTGPLVSTNADYITCPGCRGRVAR